MNQENRPTDTPPAPLENFKADFINRIRQIKKTRWIRFAIVTAIFLIWVAWLGNWWVILLLPLLFDIYITGYIPFTWWKKSENKMFKMVMSWVDAIVYALILVYFVFTFIGQNYQIPSSSLEKTLMTGDYLWVNKMSYGPRVPMTPIHFPLVQNTLPIINTRSYIEWPEWSYHRLSGFGNVQAGDIVVFNFPAGDTIAVNAQNPDYYTLKHYWGDQMINNNPAAFDTWRNLDEEEAARYRDELGRQVILNNPDQFGDVMYRPVDRRENYVKRAVGLPGQTLKIVDGQIYIDGKKQPWPENAQFNYYFQTSSPVTDDQWEELEMSMEGRNAVSLENGNSDMLVRQMRSNGFKIEPGRQLYLYCSPMTDEILSRLKKMPSLMAVMRQPAPAGEYLFPDRMSEHWTRSDYGPVMIPRKGQTVRLTAENWPMYERAIRNYENHGDSYLKNGQVYIDGKPADSYTFAMDYYFMMGDNRDNSLDSRYWGFVPEDHIVGKPMRVLISFDKDKSIFNGGIRWNRIFKDANPGF